jgi:hypothetical protein
MHGDSRGQPGSVTTLLEGSQATCISRRRRPSASAPSNWCTTTSRQLTAPCALMPPLIRQHERHAGLPYPASATAAAGVRELRSSSKEAQGKKIQQKLAEMAVALVKSRNAELAAVKELASVEARHRAELQSQIWDRGKETTGSNERVGK